MKHARNVLLPWPHWLPKQHNGCNDPCDMIFGPCACGATHHGEHKDAKINSKTVLHEIVKLHSKINRARELVGTQTDCQCQGEANCRWCKIRRILES